jgi:protein-S-isoprenylcysteine O-methyltransferase Ste14
MGKVEPVLNKMAQDGPYAFVQHPVYLGMTVWMVGVVVSARNWL